MVQSLIIGIWFLDLVGPFFSGVSWARRSWSGQFAEAVRDLLRIGCYHTKKLEFCHGASGCDFAPHEKASGVEGRPSAVRGTVLVILGGRTGDVLGKRQLL